MTSRSASSDLAEHPPVQVIPFDRLRQESRSIDGRVHVVIDANERMLPLRAIARLAVLRRRIRACGGDLIVVAGAETAGLLRHYRLEQAVPYRSDLALAVDALHSR